MHSITVTSIDADVPAIQKASLDEIETIGMLKTEVVVTGGFADVAPTYFDSESATSLETTDWSLLVSTIENANRVLGSFDECNTPDLQARWTISKTLQRLKQATEDLEVHIARNGLWLSKEEWFECDSNDKPTLYIEP